MSTCMPRGWAGIHGAGCLNNMGCDGKDPCGSNCRGGGLPGQAVVEQGMSPASPG